MNSIKGGHFVSISGVYKQQPAPRLETECQTGAPSRVRLSEQLIAVNTDHSNATTGNITIVWTPHSGIYNVLS